MCDKRKSSASPPTPSTSRRFAPSKGKQLKKDDDPLIPPCEIKDDTIIVKLQMNISRKALAEQISDLLMSKRESIDVRDFRGVYEKIINYLKNLVKKDREEESRKKREILKKKKDDASKSPSDQGTDSNPSSASSTQSETSEDSDTNNSVELMMKFSEMIKHNLDHHYRFSEDEIREIVPLFKEYIINGEENEIETIYKIVQHLLRKFC